MRERRVGAGDAFLGAWRAVRCTAVRWVAVLALGVTGGDAAFAHAAEVVLAVPAWVGPPAAGGRLLLAVGTRSALALSGPMAISQEGWTLTAGMGWPAAAGGKGAGGGVRLSGGLRAMRFDAGATADASEGAYLDPGAARRTRFSARGTGWFLEAELQRPPPWPDADGPGAAGGKQEQNPRARPELGLSAQLAWLPAAGPAWRDAAQAEGMTGFQEREAGHVALTGRRAAVGVSLWVPRLLRDPASRVKVGASAGFTHSHMGSAYQGAFSRWMGGAPVAAGERWASAAESLDALALAVGVAYQRGPLGVALSGGAVAGTLSWRSSRAERLDPQGEPVQQEFASVYPVTGHHIQVELSFSPGSRIRYRLAALQVARFDGGIDRPEQAEARFASEVAPGPPWVALPLPYRSGLAGVPADGHWHWLASVTLEL